MNSAFYQGTIWGAWIAPVEAKSGQQQKERLAYKLQSIWSVADEGKDFSPRYPLIFPKSEPSYPLGRPLFIFSKSKLMLFQIELTKWLYIVSFKQKLNS